MNLSIPLTEREQQTVENYAKEHSVSVDEAFKGALFEKIEEEFGIKPAS